MLVELGEVSPASETRAAKRLMPGSSGRSGVIQTMRTSTRHRAAIGGRLLRHPADGLLGDPEPDLVAVGAGSTWSAAGTARWCSPTRKHPSQPTAPPPCAAPVRRARGGTVDVRARSRSSLLRWLSGRALASRSSTQVDRVGSHPDGCPQVLGEWGRGPRTARAGSSSPCATVVGCAAGGGPIIRAAGKRAAPIRGG